MQVKIKQFNVDMEVANNGIEFGINAPNGGPHKGDLILTRTGLEWCEGRVRAGNGVKVSWQEFIDWMNS